MKTDFYNTPRRYYVYLLLQDTEDEEPYYFVGKTCSQAISKEQFRVTVFTAAAISGRKVKILHQLTQPADHPINIYHPEGEYLKGLVLQVS